MADAALQSALMEEYRPDAFAALCRHRAAEHGITLSDVDLMMRQDPAGVVRFRERAPDGETWPPARWLPLDIVPGEGGLVVDWHCFAGISLDWPFFIEAATRARSRPFNRLFAWRMRLTDMMRTAPRLPPPAGLIFHLSRCGSTLVHRMLAASGVVTSLSEAAPLDTTAQVCLGWESPEELKLQLLRVMAAGLGNDGSERPLVLKLEAWHILIWPLLRAAFPETPAIFLYRNPAEILVSQKRLRGVHAVPQPRIASLCGLSDYQALGIDEYCCELLAASCRAAAAAVRAGALKAINYRELPAAAFNRILPHFAVVADRSAEARMRDALHVHSKSPNIPFVVDSEEKNRDAGEQLHAMAERIVGSAYREVEALADR